ncbi:hypothetical protein J6590_008847 [Homalodisca vitripennis]|nr:hypothetical protein J6590_008847 [Homalodisca vitripennis]
MCYCDRAELDGCHKSLYTLLLAGPSRCVSSQILKLCLGVKHPYSADEPPALPDSLPPDSSEDLLSNEDMLESHTPDTLLSVEGVADDLDADRESNKCVPLPSDLEQQIKIHKGSEPLGITLDCEGDGQYGMVVTEVTEGGAVAKDGRVRPGDLILSLNYENLRRVTPAQARAILRRAQLITTDIKLVIIWQFVR